MVLTGLILRKVLIFQYDMMKKGDVKFSVTLECSLDFSRS